MPLRQIRVQRQSPLTVALGVLQPGSPAIEVLVHLHTHMGQPSVRQGELRIAINGSRQVVSSALEFFWRVSITVAETAHEIGIRFRVAAVPIPGFSYNSREPAIQCLYDAASQFILSLENVLHTEVVPLGKRDPLRDPSKSCIE